MGFYGEIWWMVLIMALFQAVGMLLKSSLPRNVDLHLEVADDRLAIEANYTELQQVLLNLALNAIQAMPHGGNLSLTASHGGQRDGERGKESGLGRSGKKHFRFHGGCLGDGCPPG